MPQSTVRRSPKPQPHAAILRGGVDPANQFARIRDNLIFNIPVTRNMASLVEFNPLNAAMRVADDIVGLLGITPKTQKDHHYTELRTNMGHQLATAIALAGYETFFKDTNIRVRRELVMWLCECSYDKKLAKYFEDYEQAWSDFLESNQFDDHDSIMFAAGDMEAEIPGSSFLWLTWPKPSCPIQQVRQ